MASEESKNKETETGNKNGCGCGRKGCLPILLVILYCSWRWVTGIPVLLDKSAIGREQGNYYLENNSSYTLQNLSVCVDDYCSDYPSVAPGEKLTFDPTDLKDSQGEELSSLLSDNYIAYIDFNCDIPFFGHQRARLGPFPED